MTAKERRRMIIDKLSETIDPEIATAIILGIDLLLIDACREQREICFEEFNKAYYNDESENNAVLNAPKPEL